jgi:hypothetical protein
MRLFHHDGYSYQRWHNTQPGWYELGQNMKHFEFGDDVGKPLLCTILDPLWFRRNSDALIAWCEQNGAALHQPVADMILMPDMATRTFFTLVWID